MHLNPLKVTFPTQSESAEEAIIDLSGRFLWATKAGCKIVHQLNDFALSELCKPLIENWKSGKVAYSKGQITLVFSAGKLSSEADLLIYTPELGDRFLYSRRSTPTSPSPSPLEGPGSRPFQSSDTQTAVHKVLEAQTTAFTQQLKKALEAQATTFAQVLSNQLTSTAFHFSQRLDAMQAQLNELQEQIRLLGLFEETPPPQTEADWLNRIQNTWGTVGDYEQYSFSHREANVETPLFQTPDWIALCELDWARKLCPTLSSLYELIHSEDGIGYAGADILQQFGRHVDPQTGESYYVYHLGGFTAYDALWQIVNTSPHSWLPELQRLSAKLSNRHPDIFQMFGWEAEAIACLESITERAYHERQSGWQSAQDSQKSHQKKSGNTLSDYLARLNIGPFTPITLEFLKRAYKQAMKTAHPDAGGSKEDAQRVNEAYEKLLKHYFPKAP